MGKEINISSHKLSFIFSQIIRNGGSFLGKNSKKGMVFLTNLKTVKNGGGKYLQKRKKWWNLIIFVSKSLKKRKKTIFCMKSLGNCMVFVWFLYGNRSWYSKKGSIFKNRFLFWFFAPFLTFSKLKNRKNRIGKPFFVLKYLKKTVSKIVAWFMLVFA